MLQVTVIVPGSLSTSTIEAKSNHLTIGTVPLITPQHQQTPVTEISASAPPLEMPPEMSEPPPYDPGNSKHELNASLLSIYSDIYIVVICLAQ